jgi:hypothetical protein
MFQVIVLGGLALTAGTAFSGAGCGNTETSVDAGSDVDAGPDTGVIEAGQDVYDAFPQEGIDVGPPDAGQDANDAFFPHEGPPDTGLPIDAGQDAYDAFPHEGPDVGPPIDAGQDAYDAFPDDAPEAGNG